MHQIAIARLDDMRHAARAGKRGMLGQMQRLAMRRNRNLRAHPVIHHRHLGAARMTRHMHEIGAVGNNLDTLLHEAVDDGAHSLLVAGNSARGKYHAVAWRQCNVGMLVLRDARHRRARLALRAGDQRHHLVARQAVIDIGGEKIRHAVKIAAVARHVDDARHRPAGDDDLASALCRRQRHGAHARHVRGEGGDGDAAACAGNQIFQIMRHITLGGTDAIAQNVGGVADQRQHALVTQCAQPRLIRRHSDHRRRVNFPVAGMHDDARRGADGEGRAFGNRMRHVYIFDAERPKLDWFVVLRDLDRNFRRAVFHAAL